MGPSPSSDLSTGSIPFESFPAHWYWGQLPERRSSVARHRRHRRIVPKIPFISIFYKWKIVLDPQISEAAFLFPPFQLISFPVLITFRFTHMIKPPTLTFFSYQGVNPLLKGHLNDDLFYLRIFCRWEFESVIVSFHHSLQIFGQYC